MHLYIIPGVSLVNTFNGDVQGKWKRTWKLLGLAGDITAVMESQLEKEMENDTETGVTLGL